MRGSEFGGAGGVGPQGSSLLRLGLVTGSGTEFSVGRGRPVVRSRPTDGGALAWDPCTQRTHFSKTTRTFKGQDS